MTSIEALKFIRDHPEAWCRPVSAHDIPQAIGIILENGTRIFSWFPFMGKPIPVVLTNSFLDDEWEITSPEEIKACLRESKRAQF